MSVEDVADREVVVEVGHIRVLSWFGGGKGIKENNC
jgi:hypothetical protein